MVVNRALDDSELETAYTTIFFSTQLSHREQVGNLLSLGDSYAAAGDAAGAQKCYERASLITTMSPTTIPTIVRIVRNFRAIRLRQAMRKLLPNTPLTISLRYYS